MITWVIGSTGLLGSAITRRCRETLASTMFTPEPIPWDDPVRASQHLAAHTTRFADMAGAGDWAIIWAAGAATVSSSMDKAEPELTALRAVVTALRDSPPAGRGAFFLTSSAGGVYAGSVGAPFTETTLVRPLSPYGEIKVQQEQTARSALDGVCPLIIGRFSNVYGPGQNLDKPQGLVSRLALATATRQPINIFVSLDTIRDYLYVDDAAQQVAALISQVILHSLARPETTVRVLASGEPVALGHLIQTMQLVTKRRVPVALGSHPSSASQVLDLRLMPSLVPNEGTSLPTGTKRVYDDIHRRLQYPRAH